MSNTRTLPTNKNGQVYYGPKTLAAAQSEINSGAEPAKVAEMLESNGYKAVAAKVRKQYGL